MSFICKHCNWPFSLAILFKSFDNCTLSSKTFWNFFFNTVVSSCWRKFSSAKKYRYTRTRRKTEIRKKLSRNIIGFIVLKSALKQFYCCMTFNYQYCEYTYVLCSYFSRFLWSLRFSRLPAPCFCICIQLYLKVYLMYSS